MAYLIAWFFNVEKMQKWIYHFHSYSFLRQNKCYKGDVSDTQRHVQDSGYRIVQDPSWKIPASHCISDIRSVKSVLGTGDFTITYRIPNNRFFRNFYFPISRLFLFIIWSKAISSKTKEKDEKNITLQYIQMKLFIFRASLCMPEEGIRRGYTTITIINHWG
jgi:hypothetical protein